jgi:serine/threonine protein kinase/Tol biopolymer transport system component
MTLNAGAKLGPYEILSPIGAGGMGEVYKARDTRLNRTVAIKVLPPHFSDNQEMKSRFEREAQTIAGLNHPHICVLHDVGQQDGTDYLVMEYLEGQTLAQRLEKGALPLEEALKIAIEIADALDKAHRQGVVHRDLKPGNVMLTKNGAKLLDFGLARLKQSTTTPAFTVSNVATEKSGLTLQGAIVGTLQYMAPEQLEGKDADARTDIFAFGAVVYEMITGKRAFEGKSQVSLIGAILERDPIPLKTMKREVSATLDHVIQRCLAKEPESRWQTANDLTVELRWVEKTPSLAAEPAVQAEQPTSASTRKVRVWMAAAGIFLAIATALGLILMLADRVPAPETVRFAISMPEGMVLYTNSISISPDGRRIAFSAIDIAAGPPYSLWVRPLDSLIAQPLPGTQGAGLTFWSPDSRSIGFFAQGKLKKIDVAGGPPQTLCDAPTGSGGSWNSEGLIIFAPDSAGPLSRVSAAGGAPTPLTKLTAMQSSHRYPAFLPDGKHFIFSATTAAGAEILLGKLESGDASVLLSASSPALFSPAGYVLFARQGVLVTQQFDTKKFRVVGEAIPVTERLLNTGNFVSASVSASGSLVYLPAAVDTGDFQLAWVDRTGKVVDTVGPAGPYRGVELSLDGKRIAVHRHEGTGGDVWLAEAQGPVRLTFDPSQDNSNPIWSPDGKRIAFGSRRGGKWGIYEKPTDGTGKEELLLELGSASALMSWSTDGKFLAYTTEHPQTGRDIWAVALTGERKPFPVVENQGRQSMPQISPDGKWIAYVSDETGRFEVYVRPFPTGEGHWQITTDGALSDSVRWRGDGKELFYMAPGANVPMMAVPINAGTTFQWGTPRKLFDSFYFGSFGSVHTFHDFSVSPDGQRFLIPQANRGAAQARATPQMTVVLNWTAALNKK